MSMLVIANALIANVGHSGRKFVLVKLADNANDNGVCWPSYQHIADQCEMGRTTVIGHIKQLEKEGFLTKIHRNGAKSSNQYQLHFVNGFSASTGADSELVQNSTSADSELGSADSEPLTGADSEPRTSHSIEPVKNHKKTKAKKVTAKTKFVPPTFEQVQAYAFERNRPDLAKKFFDYYDAGHWKDGNGTQVRNWKQKFITWENRNSPQAQGVQHGQHVSANRTANANQPSAFDQWASDQHAELNDPNWQPDF